jgi:hypothetical protein
MTVAGPTPFDPIPEEPEPTRVEILERALSDVKEALDQKLSHYALRIAMALSIITKAEEDLEHGQHR